MVYVRTAVLLARITLTLLIGGFRSRFAVEQWTLNV
jgi:hypothetical protein